MSNGEKVVSVAPYGKTMPMMQKRLESAKSDDDPERIIMRLWEERNTRSVLSRSVPMDYISHRCSSKCQRFSHCLTCQPTDEEVEVASATIQWLGSIAGREFLEEFFRTLRITRHTRDDNYYIDGPAVI